MEKKHPKNSDSYIYTRNVDGIAAADWILAFQQDHSTETGLTIGFC